MKKEIKVTKKEFKPAYTVDLTDAKTITDAYAKFGFAKHNAGLPITDDELCAICFQLTDMILDQVAESFKKNSKMIKLSGDEKVEFDCNGNFKVKKPNIFKRFWNWITRKK